MASNWAIVIGINDYQHHPERKLKYAVNDAQKIGNFLSQQAGFGEAHVIRCLGDVAHQGRPTYPTCSNLLSLLKRDLAPDRLGSVNHLWFYFSGHGVSHNGRDYLITADCLEDEIERFALPIDEVIATLRLHKDADIVLVLDACRQLLGKKAFDNSIGEQTIAAAKERGITTIFSCDYGQYSYELEPLQQGAFTYALVEGLARHTLPIQLENYLRQRVPELHRLHRQDRVEQTPRIRLESTSKTFQLLLPDAVTTADLEVLVKQAEADELEENFETAKKFWWQVIDVSQSSDQRRKARTALERIDKKIARTSFAPARFATEAELVQLFTTTSFPTEKDDLSSERFGASYYAKLRDLLKAGKWKEADHETYLRMLEAVGRKEGDWIREDELLNFPCKDLKTIDRLWVHYSKGHFGFSVQKKIYVECGGKLDGKYPGNEIWHKFCDRVGWRKDNSYVNYSDLKFNLSISLKGELPFSRGFKWGEGVMEVGGEYLVGLEWGSLLSHRDL